MRQGRPADALAHTSCVPTPVSLTVIHKKTSISSSRFIVLDRRNKMFWTFYESFGDYEFAALARGKMSLKLLNIFRLYLFRRCYFLFSFTLIKTVWEFIF